MAVDNAGEADSDDGESSVSTLHKLKKKLKSGMVAKPLR